MSAAERNAVRHLWPRLAVAVAVASLTGVVFLHASTVAVVSALDGAGISFVEHLPGMFAWLAVATAGALCWAVAARFRWTRHVFTGWAASIALVLLALRLVPATIEGGAVRAIAAVAAVAGVGWAVGRLTRDAV